MDGSRVETPASIASMPVAAEAQASPPGVRARRRLRRLRFRIVTALAAGFVTVALLAGAAFTVTVLGASESTQRLLIDRNRRLVDAQAAFLRDRLEPVAMQLELVAALAARGRLDVAAPQQVLDALAATMDQLPQISVAGVAALDLVFHRIARRPDGTLAQGSEPLAILPGAVNRFREVQAAGKPFWGDLLWYAQQHQPAINIRVPIRRADGDFIGGLIATVAMGELSRLVVSHEFDGEGRTFVLVGRNHVLAHRNLTDPGRIALSEDKPLPSIADIGDPVLAAIWDPPVRNRPYTGALGNLGHVVTVDGRNWVFVYREVTGYGPEPWLVGQYFAFEEATRDVERLRQGIWAGAGALLLAMLLAALLGLRMARAIGRLGVAAEALERFEFDGGPATRSRLREIDEAAEALEKARAALKWFGLYVPRRLVARLMEEGEDSLLSKRRTVTVMFTDIVGFTPQAEDMDESGTAELLNQHFALLGAVIEREHGVIDKYIGDSVMAVWGGIRKMPDHADAACRAALALTGVLRTDNAARRGRGLAPIRVRIGLHSGKVVIGNIGTPERMNYTVVGDTVNVAQRLEQLGKDHMTDSDETIVLISGDTLAALQDRAALGVDMVFVGEQTVRGRAEPEKIYRLA